MMRTVVSRLLVGFALIVWTSSATAQLRPPSWDAKGGDPAAAPKPPEPVVHGVPVVAFADSAFGARGRSAGLRAFGGGFGGGEDPQGIAGLEVFGAPIDRLTLSLTGERWLNARWAPSAAVMLRLLGDYEGPWALALLARYKAEGFAEVEGEVEGEVAFSLEEDRLHLDLDAVGGGGFEESEADVEAKLRAGYDVLEWLRAGLDGRARFRVAGDAALAGGRSWDVAGGAQLTASRDRFLAALTAGPSTVGVERGVGWIAMATVAGRTY